jgi:hypothetical protein
MTPRVRKVIQAVGLAIVVASMATGFALVVAVGGGVPTWVQVALGLGVAVIVVAALIPVRNR